MTHPCIAAASRLLRALEKADGPLGLENLARAADAADQVETVYQIVRHLAANHRGVTLAGRPDRPAEFTVSIRQLVSLP